MSEYEVLTVVVDVETSGMSPGKGGRVIEVGALPLECGMVVAEFETLVNCGVEISYGAYRVCPWGWFYSHRKRGDEPPTLPLPVANTSCSPHSNKPAAINP